MSQITLSKHSMHGVYYADLMIDNHNKLNCLTRTMLEQLEAHCADLERDRSVRLVIVNSHPTQPTQFFCSGADINDWGDLAPLDFARDWVRFGHRVFDRLARLPQPTMALLAGSAFGGGLELAAACDLRLMHPEAELALPEAQVGVVPGWSGSQRLVRLLPEPVLKEMALFGSRISAQRALAMGFAAAVDSDPTAHALSLLKAMQRRSAQATEIAKYLIHAGVGEDSSAVIEALGGGLAVACPDKAEGVAAFRAKRPANFAHKE